MDKNVKDKIVVVTGGGRGLGFEMINNFLKNGAKVGIIVDYNETVGNEAVAKLNAQYGANKAVYYKADITKDLDDVSQKIISAYKNIDLLVNNAGVLDEKNLRKTIEINALALMEWTMKFYDHMRLDRGGKGGTIINVSSIFGYRIIAYSPFYQGSKFAVLGFSKALGHSYNYNTSGVRVVTLCPGLTHTILADNPNMRDDDKLHELYDGIQDIEWQEPESIGKGIVEIFQKAESGTVWLVEGSRPAEELKTITII